MWTHVDASAFTSHHLIVREIQSEPSSGVITRLGEL